MPLVALQRSAGNRAVTALVQRYIGPTAVEYSPASAEGDAAFNRRAATGNYSSKPNVGVLWEGGQQVNAVTSVGIHAEKLLIGGRVVNAGGQLVNGHPNVAAYNNHQRPPAKLYTERYPCADCRPTLAAALRGDDEVCYSVASAPPAVMKATLKGYIREARLWRQDAEQMALNDN